MLGESQDGLVSLPPRVRNFLVEGFIWWLGALMFLLARPVA